MSTHPTILGEMIRQETRDDNKTSLDVERDLGLPPEAGEGDPARSRAVPRSDPARAEGQPKGSAGPR